MKSGNRQTRLNPAIWVERAKKGTTSRPNGFRDVFLARSGNSSTRSGEQARRRATLESELRRCRAWPQVTQVGGLHAHQDRAAGLWRASCRSWRTRRSTSGCSWTCVARRGGGKKMARSRFTDILNAFISGGDRRGGITTRDEKMTTLVLVLDYHHLKIWLMWSLWRVAII